MTVLLDTHYAVWLAIAPQRLNAPEQALLAGSEGAALLSAVSIWELRLKWDSFHTSGERKGPLSPEATLLIVEAFGVQFEPLTPEQAAAPLIEPLRHKDPFDALLLTQAQELGVRLLTRDGLLRGHPLAYFAQ